jgi:hypothetical protein
LPGGAGNGRKKEGEGGHQGILGEGGMSHMVFNSGEKVEEEMRELVPSVFFPSPFSTTILDPEYIY